MPQKAYMQNKKGSPIDANDVTLVNRNKKFFCCTKDCWAEMIICSAGTGHAYFKSKHKKDHINIDCVKSSITFKSDDYDEDLFDLDFAFESMLGKNHTIKKIIRGTSGTKTGTVGHHRKIRIHTLPLLYSMCISKQKNDVYNGIRIGDFFADTENYEDYKNGLSGYKVIETSFYFYSDDDMSITLNYPVNNTGKDSWVKIKFKDKALFHAQKKKLQGSMHIEPIVVAGEWVLADKNAKHHSECYIEKDSQIHHPKIQ